MKLTQIWVSRATEEKPRARPPPPPEPEKEPAELTEAEQAMLAQKK
jgi:hypothetical protein